MTLKDEVDKLIQVELSKLEQEDVANKNYKEKKQLRFQAMRKTLEEIVQSIAPEYLESRLGSSDARIAIGLRNTTSGDFKKQTSWKIEPNFHFNFRFDGLKPSDPRFIEEPGFRVEEESTYEYPESDSVQHSYTFKTEAEVAQHIVPIIAKHIASYQHLNKRLKGSAGSDPISIAGSEDS